jgi:hypothetical protein
MKKSAAFLSSILIAAGTLALQAQSVPSATARQTSLTVGGTASIFQPGYQGDLTSGCYPPYSTPCDAVANASPKALFGAGAFVDIGFSRWVQLEAEGRWLRFNKYYGISQDNYLIGPRVPVYRFHRATVYGKALIGFSKMTFDTYNDNGQYTTVAVGGGVDYKLTKRISLRAFDAEYQYWPTWGNSSLSPYGASMGVSYKIF